MADDKPEGPSIDKASMAFVSIFDAWGIFSSLAVVLLIWTRKELRHRRYLWLISNSVLACLIACVFVTPAAIHQEIAKRDLIFGYCQFYAVLLRIVHFTIPLALIMILIDRIIYIFDPILYVRKMKTPVFVFMIIFPWVMAIVFALCTYLPYQGEIAQHKFDENPNHNHCAIRYGLEHFVDREGYIVALYYALPVIFILAAILVFMVVLFKRKHCCINHLDDLDLETDSIRENTCRAVVPISFVSLAYVFLLLPFLVVLFRKIDGQDLPENALQASMWVFVSFEWFQALYWIVLLPDLRIATLLSFCCCCIELEEDDTKDPHLVRAEKRNH